MTATRALRLGVLSTLALAASLGLSTAAHAQAAKAKMKTKEVTKGSIDLNSATSEELMTLPGIGEVHARKIIETRPHKALADLTAAGIPTPTIEKIKPLVEVRPLPTPVDVNADPLDRLETLPGIGPAIAREIITARPHAGYDSIAKIKGIGPEKLDALRGRLKFGASTTPKAKAKEELRKPMTDAHEDTPARVTPGAKVNINTASREVLDALPGIGPVKAEAIIEARREKPFATIEDIMNVRGIKEGEFAKIKDRITVK